MKKSIPIDAPAVLREHEFKVTPLRVALLDTLSAATSPLTVVQLERKVRKLKANTTTVYRALQAFVEVELVHALALKKDKVSYELVRDEHKHHVVCDSCGVIESVPFCIKGISEKASLISRLFKTITTHRLEFFGTCKKCVRAVR